MSGFSLEAQLGDGSGPGLEPVFESVDFGGGIWTAFPSTATGGRVAGMEQFAQSSVVFNRSGEAVPPDGLIATLYVNTVVVPDGNYAFC